mmetsp:Transcript_7540/g.23516  ORF Transcript_7540/g.23516 Transcript_7540/m.23516 type:complete len:105 (-) Transcript_7540:1734-2048(-)
MDRTHLRKLQRQMVSETTHRLLSLHEVIRRALACRPSFGLQLPMTFTMAHHRQSQHSRLLRHTVRLFVRVVAQAVMPKIMLIAATVRCLLEPRTIRRLDLKMTR